MFIAERIEEIPLKHMLASQPVQEVSCPWFRAMPTAGALPDGQLSVTVAHIPSITRNTVSFQITPRLTGSFRYSAHGNPVINFDRSFDVHYSSAA